MCGLNGIFAYHYAANPPEKEELLATRDAMRERGPDGHGEWWSRDGKCALAHRRLSIIDLSDRAAQPMTSPGNRYVLVFNGEIYNFRELRAELEKDGYLFRTTSDSEVLLHLYARDGVEMVGKLVGMFAFAIWDEEKQQLFLARDPFGIKPLYYCDDGWTFRFASQVKALTAGGAISKELDPAAQVGFFMLGSVPEPFTTYRAIRCLPAGTTMLVDRMGGDTPVRVQKIASIYRDSIPAKFNERQIGEEIADSVRRHMISDVPVGAFLSAGIDSSALVGLMRDAGATDIQTITIGFEEFAGTPNDETRLASEVATFYGARHTTRIVTRAEFEADLPLILEAMDQPTIDGVNTWFVSKAARELGLKVAISGLGGDELFGGYPSFRDIPRWVNWMRAPASVPWLGKGIRILATQLAALSGVNPKAAGIVEYGGDYPGAWLLKRGLMMPWELSAVLDPEVVEIGLRRLDPIGLVASELRPRPHSAFARVATLETSLYMRNQLLRDTDWASMAHSLEVRVPLVDATLLSRIAPFSNSFASGVGKQALSRAPTQPVPESVVKRVKTGFTTPVANWMRAESRARGGMEMGSRRSRTPWAREWSQVVASDWRAAPVCKARA